MVRDQLKPFLATVSVFFVSLGLLGATPKKSQAYDTIIKKIQVCAGSVCHWEWRHVRAPICDNKSVCLAQDKDDPFSPCRIDVDGVLCNSAGETNCKCKNGRSGTCVCKPFSDI